MKVEGAGKKRLFAIGSPLSQALVRPIHDWAMTVLARLRMDATYNQTQPLQYLRGKRKGFSFDLKAATDSLPVILTSSMIAGLFGNPFETSWTFILCSVVFQLPYSLDNKGYRSSVVTFTKGQPLGFFSSWPLFTLTHHMLVWIAAERVYGTAKLCDYAILGDGDRRREGDGHLP